ncbi:MAG: FAD-dependent monooxygenase [Vicinamibacterales bacterium]
MRILIVGAGVAGMTLAALLERRGVRPTLVERAPDLSHAGYMLGLWPLGSRVLHGLGLYDRFVARSLLGREYEVRADDGGLVKHWSMASIADRFGPILSCTRPELVTLLREAVPTADITFGRTVEALVPTRDDVRVTFDDGADATFDLVVGADGLHSRVRDLVFGGQPAYRTGWGGWVWWADLSTCPAETFVEHWGAGRFVGAYPTRAGVGIFAGAPDTEAFSSSEPGRADRLRTRFRGMGPFVDAWLEAMPGDDAHLYYWSLSDVRSEIWSRGRVVLLGDAAAAFLPTAGIGASMAMESAAVLADELSRTDARFVEHALALFVKRRRARVERIQDDSRHLARLMFVTSATVAHVRNLLTRFYSLERLASSISTAFDEPI